MAAIAAMVLLIDQTYGIPIIDISVYVVMFMTKPDRVTSVVMNIVIMILITVLVGALFLMANGVLDHPFRLVMAIRASGAAKARPITTRAGARRT